jgi:hypothetical protein
VAGQERGAVGLLPRDPPQALCLGERPLETGEIFLSVAGDTRTDPRAIEVEE